jgi:hypothetical protein
MVKIADGIHFGFLNKGGDVWHVFVSVKLEIEGKIGLGRGWGDN